jgi:hypothetical protein
VGVHRNKKQCLWSEWVKTRARLIRPYVSFHQRPAPGAHSTAHPGTHPMCHKETRASAANFASIAVVALVAPRIVRAAILHVR